MYQHYFGLNKMPFNTTPDTRFFFHSEQHQEALSSLIYAISERKGFVLLTGEIGAGKTTICRALLNRLDPNTKVAVITNTRLTGKQLLQAICEEFNLWIPGNVGNASTFDFQLIYQPMEVSGDMVVSVEPHPEVLKRTIEAGKALEAQGCRAIVGNCGFFGGYQKVVKERINVPFFSSSLMMLPMMVHSMPGNKRVGVITANGPNLIKTQAVENCNLSLEDKENRIVIMGCENGEEFSTAIMANTGVYNPAKVEQEIVDVANQMLQENDDIGAILLECTELSPHAAAVQDAVRMPVWDYTTLTKWIYSGCIRRPFTGHM